MVYKGFEEQKSDAINQPPRQRGRPAASAIGGQAVVRSVLKSRPPARLVVMASGQGGLFEAIVRGCKLSSYTEKSPASSLNQKNIFKGDRPGGPVKAGHLPAGEFGLTARVVSLVSDKAKAGAVQKAGVCKVPVSIIAKGKSFSEWDQKMLDVLERVQPDLIVLAGFLKKMGPRVLKTFENRIINSHPALLPCYGGRGMYGIHVHRAVVEAGDFFTGVSVHLVRADYDTGPLLAQKKIAVSAGETPQSLQGKVKAVERRFYVSVIKNILEGTPVE